MTRKKVTEKAAKRADSLEKRRDSLAREAEFRARKMRADAELAEQKLAKQAGELVEADEAAEVVQNALTMFREALRTNRKLARAIREAPTEQASLKVLTTAFDAAAKLVVESLGEDAQ